MIDQYACKKAYRNVGFDELPHPEHVLNVEGDRNAQAGYSSFGRLFAIGYIQDLQQAVYAH